MSSALRALVRILAAVVLALVTTGCTSDPDSIPLRTWTLVTAGGVRASVTLPCHVNDRVPATRASYALIADVPLDPAWRGRDLVVAWPRFHGLARLRAGPVEATPLLDDTAGYRSHGPHLWRVPASATRGSTLPLAIEVDDAWTMAAWLDTVPRLTTHADGGAAFVFYRRFDDFAAMGGFCCALFAGILYLGIYLTDRRRAAYVWFTVTGLAGCTYPLFETGLVADVLGPFEVAMAACGVVLATVAEIHFVAAFFHLARPRRAWDAAAVFACVVAFASVGYFRSTQYAGPVAVAVAASAVFSQVALFVRLAIKPPHPPHLFTVLGGWALLVVLGLPDFIAWAGLGEILGGVRTASLGIFVIAFLQTITISRALARSLRDADELAEERQVRIGELERQKREVEVLNDELRRQIAARSRAMAEAIANLGSSPGDRVLAAGDVVDGRYAVERELGRGAAGSVYLVERRSDGAKLAMKVVRGTNDNMQLARLAREAQLTAEVKHENVISVVDVEVAQTGFLYVVMEYVAGESLKEHKGEYGQPSWALPILRQIAAGLASVHEHGIVHRDLKPANVLLVPRNGTGPLVKIADFGIAGVAGDVEDRITTIKTRPPGVSLTGEDLALTQTGVLMGTPLYMAPESIGGVKHAIAAVDLFAFGVIAFELLTGTSPFTESPALAQLRGINVPPAARLDSVCPGLPVEVSAMIDQCLAFEPEDRPAAREVVATFQRAGV